MIKYLMPDNWIKYDPIRISQALTGAKAAVMTLRDMPYQRGWVEDLQKMELKREVAGTSRIEGADFTDRELEEAINQSPEQLITRSQRQARAASETYRWLAGIPDDKPIDSELVCEVHRRIVTGADDDHCCPGCLRKQDENVTFGQPRHRGAEGGDECQGAFSSLVAAMDRQYSGHDPLVSALAAHYHFASMHPFLDGNGRTARALEALHLQRAGLRDFCFISMSNYYYDEKTAYLNALSSVRAGNHDLTPFLLFGLKGIESQTKRVLGEIQRAVKRAIFRNLMHELFNRLKSKRKRVIAKRQLIILNQLLAVDSMTFLELYERVMGNYSQLKNPHIAIGRDLTELNRLEAVFIERREDGVHTLSANLNWPEQITESEFFERLKKLPKAKSYRFF